jgi:hypothetical protein
VNETSRRIFVAHNSGRGKLFLGMIMRFENNNWSENFEERMDVRCQFYRWKMKENKNKMV